MPSRDRLTIRAATGTDRAWIEQVLHESWGSTTVVVGERSRDASLLPALVTEDHETRTGLLTYDVSAAGLEIVTLNALRRGAGIGTRLLQAAECLARDRGCARVWLVTTNDNLDALRFYQRRGLRIAAVMPGAADAARRIKPEIPAIGDYGIAIRDELVLAVDIRHMP